MFDAGARKSWEAGWGGGYRKGDAATSRCCAPPAETRLVADWLEIIRSPGAAVVQFKAGDRSCPRPERLNLTLSQGLRSTELCGER